MYDPDEYLRRINAKLATLGGGGQLPASADQQSMIDSVISGGLTGLQYLGETLDKPMRAIRGTINGMTDLAQGESYEDANFGGGLLNLIPFSDTMQLTDASKAVYGRDMLENVGLADQNQEGLGGGNWSLLDPSSYGNIDLADAAGDLAGFGIDLINVPLLTGTKAVTNSGRALKNAGVLDDAVINAGFNMGRRAGRSAVKSGTVDDAVRLASEINPKAADNLANYAKVNKLDMADLANQRVGYTAGVWNPFAAEGITPLDPVLDAISSVTPQSIKKGATFVRDFAEKNDFTNTLRKAFDPSAREFSTFEDQTQIGPLLRRNEDLSRNASREFMGSLVNDLGGMPERRATLEQMGRGDITSGMYRLMELDEPSLMQSGIPGIADLLPVKQRFHDYMDNLTANSEAMGIPSKTLEDDYVDYMSRKVLGKKSADPKDSMSLGVNDPGNMLRSDYLKNVPGGTAMLRKLAKETADETDPMVIEQMAGSILNNNTVQGQQQAANIAKFLVGLDPEIRKAGVYADPVGAIGARVGGGNLAQARAKTLQRVLDPNGPFAGQAGDPSVSNLLNRLGYDQSIVNNTNLTLNKATADDLLSASSKWTGPSAFDDSMLGFLDPFNNLFSALNTNVNPGFSVRNRISGAVSNFLNGGTAPLTATDGSGLAKSLVTDTPLTAEQEALARSLPGVEDSMRRMMNLAPGTPLPPQASELVPNALRELGHTALGPLNQEGKSLEHLVSATANGVQSPESVMDIGMLGGQSGDKAFSWGDYANAWKPTSMQSINPLAIEGVPQYGLKGKVQTATEFAPSKAGNVLDSRVESMNRAGPLFDRLLQGMPLDEAAKQVNASQISYAANNFTNFENEIMKRLVPFYKFQKGNMTNLVSDLAENPGGRRASLYKGIPATQRVAGTNDDPLPPHVRESIGLPLGTSADGTIRALTGLGLAEEALPAFIDPRSPVGLGTDTLYEMMGSLNPLIKAPIEAVTGKSLFQKGVMGPKDTADLDPTLSRIALNVQDTLNNLGVMDGKPLTEYQLKSMTGLPTIEAAVANSPFAKMTRLLRVMTDPRKNPEWAGGTDTMPLPLASAANLLSGLRVSDVPINSQEKALSEMIQQAYQDKLGARTMSRPYVPQYIKEGMSPEMLQQDEAFQSVLNLIDQRRRQRKQAQMGM